MLTELHHGLEVGAPKSKVDPYDAWNGWGNFWRANPFSLLLYCACRNALFEFT